MNLDALQAAALDMVNKVSIEVVKPLEDWLTNFTQIKVGRCVTHGWCGVGGAGAWEVWGRARSAWGRGGRQGRRHLRFCNKAEATMAMPSIGNS